MKFEFSKIKNWVASKETYLPGLGQLVSQTKSDTLVIGAAVFELYQIQNWIPTFKRQTGDIDLSIGVVGDASLYEAGKAILLSRSYKVDNKHPYRYHPPSSLPGGYSYIDLLAHPADQKTSPTVAAKAMGVGEGFSFRGFDFAQKETFALQKNVSFPNPFGLIALKRESYLDDPVRRRKDFADIVELVSGLVELGTHFSMETLWAKISKRVGANDIKEMCRLVISNDTRWDLDEISTELVRRGFDETFIAETLLQRVKDFYDTLK